MLGVTFGNKHSYNDWGIWLEDTHINPPLPKRYIVDVPARNGLLDLTPELTPTIRFENRTLTFNFRVKAGDWSTLVSQIYGDIHGRTLDVVSDLDPNWHWHGCVTVDDFSSDERTGMLVITVDADPFKLSNTESSYTVNGNGTITCVVDRMEISPAFELTAPTTVIYGDSSYAIESTATTEKTLSGDIVSFVDGTANPAIDLTADVTAVQDLHGYDYPWVGGAGKNLLPLTVDDLKTANTLGTWSGNAYTCKGVVFTLNTDSAGNVTSIKINGTSTEAFNFVLVSGTIALTQGSYAFSSSITGGSSYRTYFEFYNLDTSAYNGRANDVEIFTTNSFQHCYFQVRVANAQINNLTFTPQLESGSSATSFEPYTNICPISGWDEVNVVVSGINQLYSEFAWGNIDASGEDSGNMHNYIRTVSHIKVKPSTTYYFYIENDEVVQQFYVISYDKYGNALSRTQVFSGNTENPKTTSYTTSSTTATIRFFAYKTPVFSTYEDLKICMSETAQTAFVPFIGSTYFVPWTDAGTVYGGTLDVTTGVLTIDRTMIGGSSWTQYGASNGYKAYRINNCILAKYSSPAENEPMSNAISEFGSFNSSAMDKNIIQLPYSPNSTAYMALLESVDPSTVFLTYLIATPQVVQLTAEQVMILKNQNNIWADSGEVEVTYLAQDFAGKTFYIPDLELTEGSHELTIQGTGTTTATYTNGRL